MAQSGWVFLDNKGKQHRVGIYHDNFTKHLAIFCDRKLVQVDFSVKESTFYSFFIEDELCEVHLIRHPNGAFAYDFRVNDQVDTPLNREKKAARVLESRRLYLILAALAVFIGAVFVLQYFQKKWRVEKGLTERGIAANLSADQLIQLQKRGKTAVAAFYLVPEDGDTVGYYAFSTPERVRVSGKIASPDHHRPVLPTGFSLSDDDRFEVRYLPENPLVHRIDFGAPYQGTIRRYIEQALTAQQQLRPERTPDYNRCVIEAIVQQNQWKPLGVIVRYARMPGPETEAAYLKLMEAEAIRERCKVQ